MKMKKYLILVVVSLIAIAGPAIGTGGTQKPSIDKIKHRQSFLKGVFFTEQVILDLMIEKYTNLKIEPRKCELDGIREVMVEVTKLPETERYGLTRQALQTDTELRLRQYGIKVITEEQFKSKCEDLIKERAKELIKRIEYNRRLTDLLDSGQYDKALKQMKEPDKSFVEPFLSERSEERFLDSVMEYITKQEEYYKSLYSAPETPTLCINVLPLIFEQQRMAVAYVSVKLRSYIILTRGASAFFTEAVLWKKGVIMSRGLDDIGEIRDEVRDKVDEFINDYLVANPTKKPTFSPSTTKALQKGLISGIVYNEDNPSALIGDRIVHKGDTIGSVTIVKIYTDRVVFEKQGTESTIIWTQKIGEAPKANWE